MPKAAQNPARLAGVGRTSRMSSATHTRRRSGRASVSVSVIETAALAGGEDQGLQEWLL
jgi:hypothetical protein